MRERETETGLNQPIQHGWPVFVVRLPACQSRLMTLLGDSTRVKDTGTFLPYAHPHIWGWQPNGDPFELDAVRHGFARAGITSYWPILDRVKNDGPGTGQWGSVPFPPGDRDSTKIII